MTIISPFCPKKYPKIRDFKGLNIFTFNVFYNSNGITMIRLILVQFAILQTIIAGENFYRDISKKLTFNGLAIFQGGVPFLQKKQFIKH